MGGIYLKRDFGGFALPKAGVQILLRYLLDLSKLLLIFLKDEYLLSFILNFYIYFY